MTAVNFDEVPSCLYSFGINHLQIKDDIPAERLLNLQLVEEVKKELKALQRRSTQ